MIIVSFFYISYFLYNHINNIPTHNSLKCEFSDLITFGLQYEILFDISDVLDKIRYVITLMLRTL